MKQKIVPCPICSREIELLFLWDIKIFYNGCPRCKINIFAVDDDVAWVKEYSKKFQHRWWFLRFSRRYWSSGLPRIPFELHVQIKEPDLERSNKLIEPILTLYKKMYMGLQVPIDIGYYLDEKNKNQA